MEGLGVLRPDLSNSSQYQPFQSSQTWHNWLQPVTMTGKFVLYVQIPLKKFHEEMKHRGNQRGSTAVGVNILGMETRHRTRAWEHLP